MGYACRAGTATRFYWGDYFDSDNWINGYAWYQGNDGDRTMPVGGKSPNAWGLYDMAGNIWEWCQDWLQTSYTDTTPQTDPAGPTHGSDRVLRGGCFANPSSRCRAASRSSRSPDSGILITGFRVVLAPPRNP